MNRYKYAQLFDSTPEGIRIIGVVWDNWLKRATLSDVSKYQAKQWINKNQEEIHDEEEHNSNI